MASLTFQNFIFFLGSGRPQTRFSSNVVFIFQKSLNVWKDIIMSGSQACRGSPHGPVEKEICHFKAEKNKLNHSGCVLSQILLFSMFCLLVYMYFLFILLPHFVLIMYVPIL